MTEGTLVQIPKFSPIYDLEGRALSNPTELFVVMLDLVTKPFMNASSLWRCFSIYGFIWVWPHTLRQYLPYKWSE